MLLGEIGEFGLIERIRRITEPLANSYVELAIGDDAAILKSPDNFIVCSTDSFVEGVHFDLSYMTFEQLGWRLLAANLSDIAAMAATPLVALVAISVPDKTAVEDLEAFYHGISKLARRFDVAVIGGDTTISRRDIFANISITGTCRAPVLRSGARLGDKVYVTGVPGAAAAGLWALRECPDAERDKLKSLSDRHLYPDPRVSEARYLCEHFNISAMIDISDGVASEIGHIAARSTVGARIVAEKLPRSEELDSAVHLGAPSAHELALAGGEDFELLFTSADAELAARREDFEKRFDVRLSEIGDIVAVADGIRLILGDGSEEAVASTGYDHFRARP